MTGAAVVTRAMSAMTMSTGTTGTARVRSRRAVRGRGRVAATRADGEADEAAADADAEAERAAKRWKPKPLPSTFGDKADAVRNSSPFDAKTGAKSPFETVPGGKPASPFGAVAKPEALKESPFGAAEARSPFVPAPGAAKSPFGGSSSVKNPFNEPDAALYGSAPAKKKETKPVEEEKKSLLESLPRPSLGQIVIVLSFTTIISLMLGTFWVVFNAGGVHFNDS